MRPLVTVFLSGFLLDAVLSVANLWLPALGPFRQTIATVMLVAAVPVYLAMAFTRRLPKRLLLPATGFLIWAGLCGGFPLAFIWPEFTQRILEWSQLLLAAILLAVHLRRVPAASGAAFTWKNLAIFALVSIVALPLTVAAAIVNGLGTSMESATNGYLKLRPAGLILEERQLAKDGKCVRLVSMMHIGAKDFYDHVQSSLPADGRAIVLLEGISDDKELLKSRFSYAKVARLFGLTAQGSSALQRKAHSLEGDGKAPEKPEPGKLEYRRADLDVSAFRPTTIRYINAVGTLLDDPTANRLLHALRDEDSPLNGPEIQQIVMNDILNKRNEHLIAAIDKALETHETLIVPWGALHLPAIEASLKERGFQETKRVDRPVVKF